MSDETNPLQIFVAHRDEFERDRLGAITKSLGHDVPLITGSAAELTEKAIHEPATLMIVSRQLMDADGIETLVAICEVEPRPSIVLAASDDLDGVERAMDDHVMSYLIEPITEYDLRPAIYLAVKRFEYFMSLHDQVATLEERLEIRKIIERAKGILMSKSDMTESQAHKRLQEVARSQRAKIIDVARAIAESRGASHATTSSHK